MSRVLTEEMEVVVCGLGRAWAAGERGLKWWCKVAMMVQWGLVVRGYRGGSIAVAEGGCEAVCD